MAHGREKSDSAIVAVKPANKVEQSTAEPVEGGGRGECKPANAPLTRLWPGRAEFVGILKREPPEAIDDIRKAGIGPVAMQHSMIGHGTGIFTRYAKVLECDDSAMR